MKLRLPLLFWFFVLAISCNPRREVATDPAYVKEVDEWHAHRVESLKGPNGWLNIAGLFWLRDGMNSFGKGKDNTLVFPEAISFDKAGYFSLENGWVRQTLLPGVTLTLNGSPVSGTQVVFHPDSTRQPVMEFGSLRWFIIRRDTKYGVRLRDLNHPDLQHFSGIDRYPVDARWKVTARWEETPGRTIPITNVLGQTTPQPAPGVLVFTLEDKEFRLDALDEGGDELFIIFSDATNTRETYGAGRYLYVPKPRDGVVTVDFNRAENPPCAFTEFATCPLPPAQNVMDIPVYAGEKEYKHH
ncbi:MAG: DUF1684 domain-containing protein [Cyclobacteriaceae bacterium]|nr:DUF1684 domain-containing protein [Cyclobacteriaceae bacterium]